MKPVPLKIIKLLTSPAPVPTTLLVPILIPFGKVKLGKSTTPCYCFQHFINERLGKLFGPERNTVIQEQKQVCDLWP